MSLALRFAALARWMASRKAKTEARQVSRQKVQRFSAWHFKGRAERASRADGMIPSIALTALPQGRNHWNT